MNPYNLPQTLILPTDMPFARVRDTLQSLGFEAAQQGTVTPPLIEGEPEIANWTWRGTLPIVAYSFNAVARLRLLEVATVPPKLRAEIAALLKPLGARAVGDALRAEDERQRLWGIWAALETERVDLIVELARLRDSVSGMICEEIDNALHRLSDLEEARIGTLAAGRVIAGLGMELISALGDVQLLRSLLPSREDCHAAFHESVADELWTALQARPRPTRGIRAMPSEIEEIIAASAGSLRWQNELSHGFPRGYRDIAGWMQPNRVWLAWKGHEPDGGARQMDGLVFIDDHWVWMPKVYRDLEPLISLLHLGTDVPAP